MTGDHLKKRIQADVAEYYRMVHARETEFVPGKTRIPYAGRVYDERELLSLVDASLDFWLTQGKFCDAFEKGMADFLKADHCLLVNSGSSANLLAFMALTSNRLGPRSIHRGDEVITVACTFPTTVAPIIQFGAVPVFVDIELGSYNIDTSLLERAFTQRTKAVFVAHTMGNPFDLDEIGAFCQRHRLWLIEDNCDALGSTYNGRKTGTFGDISTLSFYPAHHMTMGEGGAVCCGDARIADIVRSLRDWGRDCWCPSGRDNTCGKRFERQQGQLPFGYDHKYVYSHFGYNLKATDLQGAVGCAQLEKLTGFVDRRRENHDRILRALEPLSPYFYLPCPTDKSAPSWFGFVLTLRETAGFTRNQLMIHLEKKNIQTRMLFAGNILKHPCFDGIRDNPQLYRVVGNLDNTDFVMANTLWFGVYPGLSNEMIQAIVDAIYEFIDSVSPSSRTT